jgi:PAS domain S-box-containing protein
MITNNGRKNILLVEDQLISAMDYSMSLKEYGYDVQHVSNGQKAIEAMNINNPPIDLILMDINLGKGIDGTVAAKIILKGHNIPLLFHSNHVEREIVERTQNITSYGYVVKDGITVLDASIKMAFKLYDANMDLKKQKAKIERREKDFSVFEKRYRRLFESAKDGILILNAKDGMIVDVNPFLTNMLGYSKEKFLKKYIWDISAFKNIDYSKLLFKELQEKEYVRYEDLPLETFDGEQIHVEFVSNVYLVDNEKVIQCNIRDISDRIKHEKILAADITKKKIILSELQHRAKNSFTLITSLINLRANVTQSEETKNTLKELRLRVKSISDLYTLLHVTDSIFEVRLKTYFNKITESMLNLSKNITINKQIEDITISTKNAAVAGMILVELLSNAIKYAFPDSQDGIINFEVKLVNNKIILIVEDNGIGLKEDFDVDSITTLGLMLVKQMAEQLDGKIKFESGTGTKVVIEFPL